MVKQLEKSVCGTLRAGSIVIGVFGILGGFLVIAKAFLQEHKHPFELTESPHEHDQDHDHDTGGGNPGDADSSTDEMPGKLFIQISQSVYGVVQIIVSIILIVGAVKRIARLVYPWVVVNVVLCVLVTIAIVAVGIFAMAMGNIAGGLGLILGSILSIMVQYYCILVVNSFHTTLKSGQPVATSG